MPHGWIIIALVLFLESGIVSKMLMSKWFNKGIWIKVVISNIISGVVGFALSMGLNGGWWLVTWFPWVSSNEVKREHLLFFSIYFLLAILLTLVIEIAFNLLTIGKTKEHSKSSIAIASLIANCATNLPIIVFMYLYSFRVINP